eukprot:m.81694 g.81694  ORF g.81694 m.81694 type:complete len:489 (-) comp20997_c0_seq2:59-1525(-)
MKTVTLLVAAFCALTLADDVLDLTEANFDSTLKNVDLALVEFFAPWCGHCKKLTGPYSEAATILKDSDPPVTLAKVDATVESSLASRFSVSGYPTLKIFRNGELSSDYDGPRTANGIVKYMEKQAGPSSRVLSSVADAEKFLASDFGVVGFFNAEEGALYTAFKKTADGNRDDFRFAHTTSSEVAKKYGFSNTVVVFQPKHLHSKFEDKHFEYSGKPNANAIKTFLTEKIVGVAGHMNPDNAKFFQAQKPLLTVYYDLDFKLDPSRAKYIRNRVLKVATTVASDLTFSVAKLDDFPSVGQEFAFEDKLGVAIVDGEGKKYKMRDEFSLDNLKKFVEAFANGEVEPHVKSEDIPSPNDGPVTVVVGKNFDEVVNQEGKDVFLEFYAPWCGHCKSLAPKWDKLGEKLKGEDSVIIAKIDATANDYPSYFPVRGYPSIFWVPAGSKKSPKKYEGGRELEDLVKYVKENASNPLPSLDKKKKKKKKGGKDEL